MTKLFCFSIINVGCNGGERDFSKPKTNLLSIKMHSIKTTRYVHFYKYIKTLKQGLLHVISGWTFNRTVTKYYLKIDEIFFILIRLYLWMTTRWFISNITIKVVYFKILQIHLTFNNLTSKMTRPYKKILGINFGCTVEIIYIVEIL